MPSQLCPYCGSFEIFYKPKVNKWECRLCEERFNGESPISESESAMSQNINTAQPKHIFFSYGHDANREIVERFKDDLEKRGHKVWIDYKQIGTWDDWRGTITRGIHDSQLAVAFLSIHSTRDPGVCRNEIAMALHHFGIIYPVLLEAIPWESIPATITHLQWPDLSHWRAIKQGEDSMAFELFYEEKFLEIVSRVEGEATRFAAESEVLRRGLAPSVFDTKFAQHLDGFLGRGWCFEAFEDWLNNQPDSRVFWLKAGPGFGKTALAVNLANRYRAALVGTWFCDWQSQDLSDPRQALATLAFQLALRWEDYRSRLLVGLCLFTGSREEQVSKTKEFLGKKNLRDLFDFLLAGPLSGLIWREHKLVILLDALDEVSCVAEGRNDLAALIGSEFLKLPKWISFVVTSRPDALVSGHLQRFKPFIIAADDTRNDADLRQFISQRILVHSEIKKIPELKRAELCNALIAKSSGMLLYLSLIEEGLLDGTLKLVEIEGTQAEMAGLYSRYQQSFEHRLGAKDFPATFQPIIRLLLAAPGALPLDLAVEVLGICREEGLRMQTLMGGFLIEDARGLGLFHKTLSEWLGSQEAGLFYTDARPARKQLGEYLWKCFKERKINRFGLTITLRWEEHVMGWLPTILLDKGDWEDKEDKEDVLLITDFGRYLIEKYRLKDAEDIYLRALAISENNRALNGQIRSKIWSEIGDLYFLKGDFQKSVEFHRKALETRIINLGLSLKDIPCWGVSKNSPEIVNWENKVTRAHIPLAESLFRLARAISANSFSYEVEWLYRRSLFLLMAIEGFSHPETAQVVAEMVDTFDTLGHSGNCEPMCRNAMENMLKLYGDENPRVADAMIQLAKWTHDHLEYKDLMKKAYTIRLKTLGPDHLQTAESLLAIGNIQQYKQNELEMAKDSYERALNVFLKVYHPEHALIKETKKLLREIEGL